MRGVSRSFRDVPSLWPGHAETRLANSWQPETYPLNPGAASCFLGRLQAMSWRDLESMRHSLSAVAYRSAVEESGELAALARFTGKRVAKDSQVIAAELAQQLLLWSWHWESIQQDLASLEQACYAQELALDDCLSGGDDVAARQPGNGYGAIQELAWRPVVANALFFIAPEQAIVAEGEMAKDLGELLDFESCEAGAYGVASGLGELVQAEAPLWQALGYSRPVNGEAARIYNQARIWLIRRKR